MFLNKVNYRITGLFTLLFTLLSALTFSFLFILLQTFLRNEDHANLNFKLLGLEAQYHIGGVNMVVSKLDITDMMINGRPYFIRIVKGPNDVFLCPSGWQSFDFTPLQQAVHGEITTLTSRELNYELEVLTTITPDNCIIQTGISTQYRKNLTSILFKVFLIVFIPLIILSLILGTYFSSRALKPIENLTKAFKEIIHTGKRKKTPEAAGNGDLKELTRLFNIMLDKNETLIVGMKETLDNVSHDLRTPLTRLRGAAEVALSSGNPEIWSEALSDCIEESDSILKILNAIMDITAAENGVMTLNQTQFNLSKIIDSTADFYSFLAEEKMIRIKTYVDEDLIINADEGKLRQAVANLIDNAVKYSDNGGVIEILADKTRDSVEIKIRDNGKGISPLEINNIWDRLYRCSESRSEQGLGLGLSMVKAVIQAHKGEVSVTSTEGLGSVFTINIPLATNSDETVSAEKTEKD